MPARICFKQKPHQDMDGIESGGVTTYLAAGMAVVCVVMMTVIGGETLGPMIEGGGGGGRRWRRWSCRDRNRSLHTVPWSPENLCQIVH